MDARSRNHTYDVIVVGLGGMGSARAGFDDIPRNVDWAYCLTEAAAACAELRDTAAAEVLWPLLAPYADQVVFSGCANGVISHHLGTLATVRARFAEAEAHFVAAADVDARLAALTWLARTRLEWARMLLARRAPGDDQRARELLRQALTTARELGLANVERGAAGLLK